MRRQLLDMAQRRAARGSGSSHTFLDRRTAIQPVPSLDFLSVPWVLVGDLAIRAHMPERITTELDVLIHHSDEPQARKDFQQADYLVDKSLSTDGFTAHRGDEVPIRILAGRAAWVQEAIQQPFRDAAGVAVLGRSHLMLTKLLAGRPQDLVDVQRMLRDTPEQERQNTRALINQYAPDMAEDYDQIIAIANAEFK